MDANQRLDYFRSEFEGKLSTLRKELADERAASRELIRQLTEQVDKLVREVKNVALSVG